MSFTLGTGEVVGVAALEGQGQQALFNALAGVTPISGGGLRINGRIVKICSTVTAKKSGLSFVPEERKRDGLFFGLPTAAMFRFQGLVESAAPG